MSDELSDQLTNEAVPRTHATLTIRVIKSFEFRTEKSLVLRDVNCETTTVAQLKEMARQGVYICALLLLQMNRLLTVVLPQNVLEKL